MEIRESNGVTLWITLRATAAETSGVGVRGRQGAMPTPAPPNGSRAGPDWEPGDVSRHAGRAAARAAPGFGGRLRGTNANPAPCDRWESAGAPGWESTGGSWRPSPAPLGAWWEPEGGWRESRCPFRSAVGKVGARRRAPTTRQGRRSRGGTQKATRLVRRKADLDLVGGQLPGAAYVRGPHAGWSRTQPSATSPCAATRTFCEPAF